MTPEQFAANMERHGEPVTLSRKVGEQVFTLEDLPAKLSGGIGTMLLGTQTVMTRLAIIAHLPLEAAGWPAPPKKGDTLVSGGRTYTVQSADRKCIGADPAGYHCTVTG